jgi:hypothetical protein
MVPIVVQGTPQFGKQRNGPPPLRRIFAMLEIHQCHRYSIVMSHTTTAIIEVCEALPPEKQAELADFARFLLAQQDDTAWEQRLADPKSRPRLDVFLRDSAAEGDEPFDPSRL